jgi:hypothetical protein
MKFDPACEPRVSVTGVTTVDYRPALARAASGLDMGTAYF